MPNYGFRLFNLELHKRNSRGAGIAFLDDDIDYRSHILDACALAGERTFRGSPAADPADEPDADSKKHPVVTGLVTQKCGSAVLGRFRYGRDSDFDSAVPTSAEDPRGDSIDIKDTAPTRTYRFLVLFPSDHGNASAMLAVEAIGRACPATPLVRWLRRWSQDLAAENGTEEWYRLRAYATVDPAELMNHLKQSQVVEMELRSHRASQARRRKPVDFSLKSNLDASGTRERALKKLTDGIAAAQDEEQFANELAELVGVSPDALDFDEGWLVLDTPGVGKQKVSVSHLPEVFTYPIDSVWPSDPEFLSAVKRRITLIPGPAAAGIDRGW